MPPRVLLLDAFGTVLDWAKPFADVNDDALRRGFASVDGITRLPPFADWRAKYQEIREEERRAKDPTHEERDYRARFVEAFSRAGLAKRQARVLGEKACERYFRELDASIRLAPDATPELWRALPEGIRLGLVSNYGDGQGLRRALDRLGVFYRFETVIASGDVGYLKPHPKVFERALADLDATPEECLFVGDDLERDVLAPRALGMRAALVANPRAGLRDARASPLAAPDGVETLASLADLPALVARG